MIKYGEVTLVSMLGRCQTSKNHVVRRLTERNLLRAPLWNKSERKYAWSLAS